MDLDAQFGADEMGIEVYSGNSEQDLHRETALAQKLIRGGWMLPRDFQEAAEEAGHSPEFCLTQKGVEVSCLQNEGCKWSMIVPSGPTPEIAKCVRPS